MPNFRQGAYTVKNKEKYVGKGTPRYRSGWELTFMMFLDNNDNILQWASESIKIPYQDPHNGKLRTYIPDFFMVLIDSTGARRGEIIEIKPYKETVLTPKSTDRDKYALAVNHAKWKAASDFATQQGLTFRILTERSMFANGKSK